MEESKFLELVSYVIRSTYRKKVLFCLDEEYKTPTSIAKCSNIKTNHISKVLNELKQHGLIYCINEQDKKGRLYVSTSLGSEIIFYIKSSGVE